MPLFKVDPELFQQANEYFKTHPPTKPGQVKKFSRKRETGDSEKLDEAVRENSFVMVGGVVFAVKPDKNECVGEGNFGRVWLVQTEEGQDYAMKVIGEETIAVDEDSLGVTEEQKEDMMMDFENEVGILRELGKLVAVGRRDEHINRDYLDYDNIEAKHYVIMKLEEGTSLFQSLESDKLNAAQKLETALKAAMDIRFLHEHRIIHGDIKPENFMANYKGEQITVGSVDYGHSLKLPQGKDHIMTTPRGSTGRIPPEIQLLMDEDEPIPVSFKTDVYAFGVMLRDDFQLTSPLIEKMLSSNPDDPAQKQRPSMDEVVWDLAKSLKQHPEATDAQKALVERLSASIPDSVKQASPEIPQRAVPSKPATSNWGAAPKVRQETSGWGGTKPTAARNDGGFLSARASNPSSPSSSPNASPPQRGFTGFGSRGASPPSSPDSSGPEQSPPRRGFTGFGSRGAPAPSPTHSSAPDSAAPKRQTFLSSRGATETKETKPSVETRLEESTAEKRRAPEQLESEKSKAPKPGSR